MKAELITAAIGLYLTITFALTGIAMEISSKCTVITLAPICN